MITLSIIRIKRVYDPPAADDGRRVLCTIRWPRGIRRNAVDDWKPELGTPLPLLEPWLAGQLSPEEFTTAMRTALAAPAAAAALDALAANVQQGLPLTLLTSVRDLSRTHLTVVRAMVEERLAP